MGDDDLTCACETRYLIDIPKKYRNDKGTFDVYFCLKCNKYYAKIGDEYKSLRFDRWSEKLELETD